MTYPKETTIVLEGAVDDSVGTVTGSLINVTLDVLATDTKHTTQGTPHWKLVTHQNFMFLENKLMINNLYL